jgi:hypothetical protein
MNSGNDLSRNRSSSESAGISPYDYKPVIIHFFRSTIFCRSLECGGKGGSPRVARAEALAWPGQKPSRGKGRSPRVARAEALAWQGQKPSRGQGRSPRVARAGALAWQEAAF